MPLKTQVETYRESQVHGKQKEMEHPVEREAILTRSQGETDHDPRRTKVVGGAVWVQERCS